MAKDAFLAEVTVGLKESIQWEPSFIIAHTRRKTDFVHLSKMVFLAQKGMAGYYVNLDSERCKIWFEEQLMPNLETGSIISWTMHHIILEN